MYVSAYNGVANYEASVITSTTVLSGFGGNKEMHCELRLGQHAETDVDCIAAMQIMTLLKDVECGVISRLSS